VTERNREILGAVVGSSRLRLYLFEIFTALAELCEPMHHVKWDCFVWPADLDCGKASPLLPSSLDLGRIPAAP
jgi:hypothetical protein